ncbi:MAG: holo-ACP synthase [Nitrospira sp.]|nr:holo-ACP synthase [bacterium]MBL7048975.1 holo-ACP synthase [Nitrospira sp.]
MMQIYQGIDIVEIGKFREIILRHPDFIPDIFTEKERAYCDSKKDSSVHYAGRFAAKEAGIKALGIGMSGGGIDHTLREIEVLPSKSGRPELQLSGWIEKLSQKKHISQLTVSISHSEHYAIASVVLTGKQNTV